MDQIAPASQRGRLVGIFLARQESNGRRNPRQAQKILAARSNYPDFHLEKPTNRMYF
jgi:hypothetical protein